MNHLPKRSLELSSNRRALFKVLLQEEGITGLPIPEIARRQDRASLPLSFAQQRLWFLDQLEPDSPVYNITRFFYLIGSLNLLALEQSFREIARRHEVLRTTFPVADGKVVQVVLPALTERIFSVVDLAELPQCEREAQIQQLAYEEAQRPFDLVQGPLIRVQLLHESINKHILLLSIHHIVCDGWSLNILIREISTLYQAYSQGRPSPLPELPLQYADYTLWQREWLQGSVLATQLAYWEQHLQGAPSILELPVDHTRSVERAFQGDHYTYELPQDLSEALASLSRREDVTLFMTLLAAFTTLLSRYSRQEDLVIGTPIANRTRAGIEDLIGNFANTLALRFDLSGALSFQNLLTQVREVCLAGYAHQDLPFEYLVEVLEPERNLHYSPLFQVMFAFQSDQPQSLHLPGLTVSSLSLSYPATARMDVMLTIVSTPEGLHLDFEYRTKLFEASTIARMAAHLQQLLESIVADPQQPLAALTLLTQAEQQRLLDWNTTQQPYERSLCLHQFFEAQVERTPEHVALVCQDEHLTYYELNRRANRLAQYLHSLGVGPEKPVGLCLERNPDLIVALLAVLKTGGAYVPLDPRYPPERLAFMLSDAQATFLLTQQAWQERPALQGVSIVYLDGIDTLLSRESEAKPENLVLAENLAYMIYTSGSTGRPKGVAITHRSAVALLSWALRQFPAELLTGVLASTSLNFDLSIFELFVPLCSGGTVILAQDALHLLDLSAAQGVTLLNTVPSVLTALLQAGSLPSSVRAVTLAGEALSSVLVQHLYALGTVQQVYNLYGPTEDTTYSTWALLPPEPGESVPIGRPIANTQAYLLDSSLAPVPIGRVGELYLGGEGLARGYLHQPALTAERFLPDPFSSLPGGRLYRTGDLAYYQDDGSLQFVGRVDTQVKLRGYRIELGEIEALLRQHPGVREAVVLLREDAPGEKRLVGYIVPQGAGPELATSQLRAYLGHKVPEYMIPVDYVMLGSLPLSLNGKVDRAALPAPAGVRWEGDSSQRGARTALEEVVIGIWEQVLSVEGVGVQDNFFEIGGHSLLATQVVARLARALQIELPLRTFFEAPTVAELARYLNQAYQGGAVQSLPFLQTLPRPADLPLSFAQQRLWFLDQMEPDSSFYNLSASLSLTGLLHIAALEQSLNGIVSRHEALRTSFRVVNGQPVQVVISKLHVPLLLVALEKLSTSQQAKEVRRLIREEFLLPFDLAAGPLMRIHLLRLGAEEHILLLSLHHIICDGWSMKVLMYEFSSLYQAYSQEQASPLPELPLQYADYTLWQREWLQGEILQAHLAYWQQQLAGAPTMLELPTDRPRPAIQTFRGAFQRVALSQELTERLKALSRKEGVTLFMTLLAAFATLLSRYSGQEDILIGTPIANRQHAQLEDLIGCFANTLVLRTDLSGAPSFRELMGRVREMALEAYAHQDLPFEKLVEVLEPERSSSHSPLFQVMFALQNVTNSPLALAELGVELLEVENRASKYDLGLSLQETPDGLTGVLEYNIDLFDATTIERMGGHLQQLLEGIVADPEQRLRTLPWLMEKERQQILEEWNWTQAAYPQECSLSQILEQQVQRTPDAVALVFEEEHLTYQELNERANQLARYLRKQGVGPEVLVGISLERSLDLVVGVLGILKAGGAYVPFDPGYPTERLTFMLHDTRTPILLTQTHLLERLPTMVSQQICLDRDWPLFATESRSNVPYELGPDTLAYMIYTSGSTGRPKGVLIPHRGVCNLAEVQIHIFGIQPGDRVLQFASLSFDASLWEIIMALYAGATLCLATRETLLPGSALVGLLQEQAITAVTLPPSALSVLPVVAFPALQVILTTGEACSAELVEAWATGHRFFNGYGPTETTICATVFECHDSSSKPPIGHPIANTQIYVLDANMQLVPIGVPGEMYIGGETVARGYHNRPELTAERFVPHPFSLRPGQRLYRTGDLARYLPDGLLEFVGRVDTQVKLRGYRIELGEIETALRQYPDVQEAVVLMREDLPGDKRLIAYVVGTGQSSPISVSDLRRHLQEHLPEYMVPSTLILLESLPLNANGKVDHRLLPVPEGLRPEMETNYLAPQTPMERTIAAAWQEMLHMERIGIHDNFFDLGGHSLLMVQVQDKLREVLNRDLTIVDMFKYPTISSLAKYLSQKQGDLSLSRQSDERIEKLRDGKNRLKRVRERTPRGIRNGKER